MGLSRPAGGEEAGQAAKGRAWPWRGGGRPAGVQVSWIGAVNAAGTGVLCSTGKQSSGDRDLAPASRGVSEAGEAAAGGLDPQRIRSETVGSRRRRTAAAWDSMGAMAGSTAASWGS